MWYLYYMDSFKRPLLYVFLILGMIYLVPSAVYAADPPGVDCSSQTYGNLACLPMYLKNIVNGFLALSGVTAVILICLSGIRYIISGGDSMKMEKAKKSLTYAIIGFVIVLLSFVIVNTVGYITGAQFL